jgi:putative ABC transport system permease protein
LLALILRNLLRNRRRSLLTVLSAGISIGLLAVLLSLYHAFFMRAPQGSEALRLITSHRVSVTNLLPLHYRDKIRKAPGVRECMVFQWFGGVYKAARDADNMFARFAIEPERLFVIFPEFTLPEEQKRAFIRDRRGALVGRVLADRLGFKVGQPLHIRGDLFPMDLELVIQGIYDSPRFNDSLFFHYDYIVEGVRFLLSNASMFVSVVERPGDIDSAAQAIDALFRNATDETRTDTDLAFERNFLSYLGDIKVFMLAVSLALTSMLLFVCANTMSMSIRERIREVGILKTLGFGEGRILSMIVGEAVLLAVAGAGAGLGLGELVNAGLRSLPSHLIDLDPVALNAGIAAVCLAAAAGIGVASSIFAARSAVRRPITQALRFVD